MSEIKNFLKDINVSVIPKSVYNEFCKHNGKEDSELVNRVMNEVSHVRGNDDCPLFGAWKIEGYSYYLNTKYYGSLLNELQKGLYCLDSKKKLSRKDLTSFFLEYAKGFEQGYYAFQDKLKKLSGEDSLFNDSKDTIKLKVFSRISKIGTKYKDGKFIYHLYKYNDSIPEGFFGIQRKDFFMQGVEGGGFYKAWEIILNNPYEFESIFDKYSVPSQDDDGENYNKRIFKTNEAFKFFKYLIKSVGERNQLADVSFIIRKMINDDLIYADVVHRELIDMLSKDYQIVITKIKTLNDCKTDEKLRNYNLSKQLYL
tara:strand:+ start:182 stop:1120 length:939 start_codon:yes stop_codon:yes gene_type:complete